MEDQAGLRRHRGACPLYREHWFNAGDISDPRQRASLLYAAFCLQDTPPETLDEQYRCLRSRRRCWRTLSQFRQHARP